MEKQVYYLVLADAVLITHALYIVFIIGGLVMILLGAAFHWQWVRNFFFRALHLAAIAFVVLQSWVEQICPLTTLEMYLRKKAGKSVYHETFMEHWLHELIFYEASFWVFSICYTLFSLIVLCAWLFIPPNVPWNRTSR